MRVGNAPVSWGVYEATGTNPPFGVVLDAISQAGYEGTELGPYGYLPTTPEALDQELRSRRLALGSSFVALPLEDPSRRAQSVDHALAVARLLKTQDVGELILADDEDPARARIAGRVPMDGSAGLSEQSWREALATLHAVARALRDVLGMRAVFHHHAGTFVETPAEIERLLEQTDPEMIGLLLDTGHAVYGGGDPLELVMRHGQRIRYVHLKDARRSELDRVRQTEISMQDAWGRGVFCALGEGVVDFPRLIEALRRRGYASAWTIVAATSAEELERWRSTSEE
jgi:inosose dehydratase